MLAEDLGLYQSLVIAADNTNGGRMSANKIISGVNSNVFPPILSPERLAETVTLRKTFFKVNDADDGTGFVPKIFLDGDAQGDDYCVFWPGTQRDTQADITGSERFYTAGLLDADVSAGANTLTVAVKDLEQVDGFQNGDTIRISNKALYNSGTGTEQYLTVNADPVVVDNVLTLTFDEPLLMPYAAGSKVSSVYEPADIACSLDGTGFTGGADIDFAAIVLGNVGTTDEDYTATFTDATHYTVTGDSLGAIGSGTTGADFSPMHPSWSSPRFTIPAAAFDGLTISAGDTFSFSTHPASVPIWEKKTNPADATETNSNYLWLIMRVEAVAS